MASLTGLRDLALVREILSRKQYSPQYKIDAITYFSSIGRINPMKLPVKLLNALGNAARDLQASRDKDSFIESIGTLAGISKLAGGFLTAGPVGLSVAAASLAAPELVSKLAPVAPLAQSLAGGNMGIFDESGSLDLGGVLATGTSLLQNVLDAKLAARAVESVPQVAAMTAGTQVAMAGLPALGRALGGSALVAGAAGLVRAASGAIRGVIMAGGKFISRKKAVALAKRVGLDAAAAALGVTAVEMAQMVLEESGGGARRGRGITAASMKTTRRTIRAVMGLHRQIVSACSSARVPFRRRGGGGFAPRLAVSCAPGKR